MELDYPRQKRKMKRDLNLEGFSVLGSIIDCVAEFLEGPPDEDEARTEVLILSFSRLRTRTRVRYLFFRGRDEALALVFCPFPRQFRGKNED